MNSLLLKMKEVATFCMKTASLFTQKRYEVYSFGEEQLLFSLSLGWFKSFQGSCSRLKTLFWLAARSVLQGEGLGKEENGV